jgi:raffinose/stachyose/melibiose transport system substrate-binding protein
MSPLLTPARAAAVLALTLLLATLALRHWRLAHPRDDAGRTIDVLRVAHPLLDAGVREAFDAVAREFERIEAGRGSPVEIRQIPIPARVYSPWLRTQLIGETAPEIVYSAIGLSDTLTARYLRFIGTDIEAANPYNDGSPLAGRRWRDTFPEGLEFSGYDWELSENVGIPFAGQTTRLVINLDLLDLVLSSPENAALRARLGGGMPRTFTDFIAACEAAAAFGLASGQRLVGIAGSDYNGTLVLDQIRGAMTQRFGTGRTEFGDFRDYTPNILLDVIAGRKRYDDEQWLAVFRVQRALAVHLQPGFAQLRREDATFAFAQGRALSIVATSWDAPTLRELAANALRLGITPVPLPDRSTPEFGDWVIAPVSEHLERAQGVFSVTSRTAPRLQERALDFLRFLTSFQGNRIFSERSGWLPGIVELPAPTSIRPFERRLEGLPPGPRLEFNSAEIQRHFLVNLHLLTSPRGSAETFAAEFQRGAPAVARAAFQRSSRQYWANLGQQSTMLAAEWALAADAGTAPSRDRKRQILVETISTNQSSFIHYDRALAELPAAR